MSRFYVARPEIVNGVLRVEGGEVRHIRKVLRLRIGDGLTLFDGAGMEYEGTIVEESGSSVSVLIRHHSPSKREADLEISLAQSLLKGEKMDYVIQKATELGVKWLLPFFSSRSVPHLDPSRQHKRHLRWEKVIIGASKQSGRGMLPRIEPLQDYSRLLESVPEESFRLILWEGKGERLKDVLKKKKRRKDIFFIVGPEGGFSEDEIEEARGAGFIPVTLGERILRAETASLCLLSVLQYEWGDIG